MKNTNLSLRTSSAISENSANAKRHVCRSSHHGKSPVPYFPNGRSVGPKDLAELNWQELLYRKIEQMYRHADKKSVLTN